MTAPVTEQLHAHAEGLDALPLVEIAGVIAAAQTAAAASVEAAAPAIAKGAAAMAETLRGGGTLVYAAAGSSGLMAAADAMELGGTFAIPADRIRIVMAGGLPTGPEMPGATEDGVAEIDAGFSEIGAGDCVITVSASGSTPFTVAAARTARAQGAKVIGIANNSGSALLDLADYPVLLETPPEVLAGSTRMGAGTAQKIALNALSTLMAVKLGHVHDGMMVNVFADNAKLKQRAAGIVARIAEVDVTQAEAALEQTGGAVKPAVLLARSGGSVDDARAALDATGGRLRDALKTTSLSQV